MVVKRKMKAEEINPDVFSSNLGLMRQIMN
jgi:hypothetical protein